MNPKQLIENRSVRTIFRDCLKVAPRMVDDPMKIRAVRMLMKQEFFKHKDVLNEDEIRDLKMTAARGISNYIIHNVKEQYIAPRDDRSILDEGQGEIDKGPGKADL